MTFNLLMAGNDEDWAVPLGVEHRDQFALSRYLEYTDPEIANELRPVSTASLRSIQDYPALFMSELSGDREISRHDYVTMRVGRVFDLKVVRGFIHYGFVIERDLGRVPVIDRSAFEKMVGLGRLELTRTHWAIKPGDLDAVLAMLTPEPEQSLPVAPEAEPADADESGEPQIVESLERFLEIMLEEKPSASKDVFYRGHSDKSYQLEPSLFRKNDRGGYRHLRGEAYLVNELLTAHPAEFASDQFMIDKLVRMQHYGLPTRLLDVTSNPLVALYFCCSSIKYDDDGNEIDGEVIVLRTNRDEIKFFNSDTVSCIANLAMLDDKHKNAMDTALELEEFNESDSAQRLLHMIGAEKPYFKPRIVPADLNGIVFVRGRNSNSRISSQSGAFLIFGHDAILPETGHSSLDIRRITVRNKTAILDQLARLNIRSSTIYPGIDKTAAEIAKQHENLD